MKNFILIVFLFFTTNSSSQSFTNFDLNSHGCLFAGPPAPDTLSYSFSNDTLHLELVKWGHCCPKPYTTMIQSSDTFAINIQDTTTLFCACDCFYRYEYSLYGFTGNQYYIDYCGKVFSLTRTTGLEPTSEKLKYFEKRGNILFINNYNTDFSLQIFDLNGRLKNVFHDDKIDLNSLGLRPGVYLFRLMGKEVNYSEKFFLD